MKRILMSVLCITIIFSLYSMDAQKDRNAGRSLWPHEGMFRQNLESNRGAFISTGPSQTIQVGIDMFVAQSRCRRIFRGGFWQVDTQHNRCRRVADAALFTALVGQLELGALCRGCA